MLICDANVLIYAHREDAEEHPRYRAWLEDLLSDAAPYGVSDVALSGFVRVVTHPRIFRVPTPLSSALAFARVVREQPTAVALSPGPRHWEIFERLCLDVAARGSLVPDAWFAALAIEHDAEWVTTDADYARFPGLRWRHPLRG